MVTMHSVIMVLEGTSYETMVLMFFEWILTSSRMVYYPKLCLFITSSQLCVKYIYFLLHFDFISCILCIHACIV
jgi:hypothetical protein